MSSLQTLARRALPLLMVLGAASVTLPAQAGGVQWSVGIHVPMPGVIVYPAPPQVIHVPQPVHGQPRRVYVQPPPPYSRGHYAQEPEVVYLSPREHRHWHHRRQEWRDDPRGHDRGDHGHDGRYGR